MGIKKYALDLKDFMIILEGTKLYRIISTGENPSFPKGLKGGYIQSEKNLDHDGDCWIGEMPEYIDMPKFLGIPVLTAMPEFLDMPKFLEMLKFMRMFRFL